MVTVACEHSPVFLANIDSEGLLTLDRLVMLSVVEWYNSLSKSTDNQAYYQPEPDVFIFSEDGMFSEYEQEPDGTYVCPDWLERTDACQQCLNYVQCDCEFELLTPEHLAQLESRTVMGYDPLQSEVRSLIYMIRELEAQLKVEQEKL